MRTLASLPLVLSIAWGQSVNPLANDPKAAETGKGIFRIYCGPCHGIRAQGGKGPDLTRGSFRSGDSDADLYRVIAEGVPGSEMSSFGTALTADGVWRVIAYLRAINRPGTTKVAGDAAEGERLFWGKAACGQCHRVGTRGGRFGPDLSRAGRSRSVAHLTAAVIEPDTDITPGYATVIVVTRDNRKVEGVERNRDNFSVQLMDAGERFHSFVREEVDSIRSEPRSLMPSYKGKFAATELENLLAYLVSLGNKESN